MVARDHEALIGPRPGNHSPKPFQTLPKAARGVGRAGVTKDPCARTLAAGDTLDKLRGLLDPPGLQHRAGIKKHQPWRSGLTPSRGERGSARSVKGQKPAACDIG